MTQNERILEHMRKYGSITQAEAMKDYGIMRLGARIYDLRREGYRINAAFIKGKNRYGEPVSYASYSMEEVKENGSI